MALTERLADTPQRGPGTPCSVGRLLDELPTDEADALRQMLGPLGWAASAIYTALESEGHYVGRQTINRHRSRSCRCFAARP